MKVRELIEDLRTMDPEADVHIGYTASDYWNTEIAPADHSVDEELVKHSAYHRCDQLVTSEDDSEDGDTDARPVVVISRNN